MMRRILLISLAINLALLTLAGIFIYQKGGVPYLSHKLGLNEPVSRISREAENYAGRVSTFMALPRRENSIIFAGDSLIELCPWHELLGDVNAASNRRQDGDFDIEPRVLGRGISGDTVNGLRSRLDEILRHKPRKLFLMIGINDLLHGKAVDDLMRGYVTLIASVRTSSPHTQLYVHSILPINAERWGPVPPRLNADIVRANRWLAEMVAAQPVDKGAQGEQNSRGDPIVYIDLYSQLADAANQLDLRYTYDGVHLTGAGYLKCRELLQAHLRADTPAVQ